MKQARGHRAQRSLAAIAGLFSLLGLVNCAESPDDSPSLELRDGWQYRFGDSPLDTRGVPAWTYDPGDPAEWEPFDLDKGLPEGDGEIIWLRVEMPEGSGWRDPALRLGVFLPYEAYLHGELIHRSGEIGPWRGNKYAAFELHIVPIPRDFPGRTLALRIYWGPRHYFSPELRVSVGSHAVQARTAIRRGLDQVIPGWLLMIIGLFGLYTFARRRERSALSFGILSVCVGLYTTSGADTRPFLPEAPVFWWHAFYLGLFFFPVGLWSFFEPVFHGGGRSFFRRLWQAHLIYGLVFVTLDLLDVVPIYAGIEFLMAMLAAGLLGMLYTLARTASRATTEVKILAGGAVFLMLFGLHDILEGFQLLPWDFFVFHWGIFLFVLLLAFLLERRFAEAHQRLQVQSESLRISKAELEQYSRTLEEKVAARTRDLAAKNSALADALSELQETQNQLIMREKMASLGNLVAGVAHEVNSPIGAVNSAADVSSRCLDRMMAALDRSEAREEVARNRPFQQAASLLKDNTDLIMNAGERIATIVRSLRSFARLDEAEFQSADLHQGLDSTLTLVHHELKQKAEVIKEYGDIPTVECYPNQLNQVFMNLLVNAAHAIEDKGTIRITTRAAGGQVQVRIADTGRGIAREHLGRIFDPGFTTKGVGVGVGLGLSISYSIIEKHRGRIEVESEPGRGTVFTITLPIHAPRGPGD